MFLSEFKNNKILWWAWGALLFAYFTALQTKPTLIGLEAWRQGTFICPPYFQDCSWLYFLEFLPYGYSGTILYMAFFGLLLLGVWFLYKQQWDYLWAVTAPIWLWHVLVTLVFSYVYRADYQVYIAVWSTILLFFPHKEFFLKLSLVWLYVLSTIAKIHPGWIEGTIFTFRPLGLPLISDFLAVLATNIVILMEMIGAWFLLSNHPRLQRAALVFFVFFHLYSSLLIGYTFPSVVLPVLLILFGPWYRYQVPPIDHKSIIGWSFIVLLLCLQLSPKFIPGDEKLTMEGNKYGLKMFSSQSRCVNSYRGISGEQDHLVPLSTLSMINDTCDPYNWWYQLNNHCQRNKDLRVEWQLHHSINGGPFYTIVDIEDVCSLEYHPWKHNEWIKRVEDGPAIFGYPIRSSYNATMTSTDAQTYSIHQNARGQNIVVIQELDPDNSVQYPPMQQWIHARYSLFEFGYVVLLIATLVVVLYRGVYVPHFSRDK